MSFRKAGLFFSVCVLVAWGSVASMFLVDARAAYYVTQYVVSPLGEFGQSVSDWWNAPSRSQLTGQVEALEALLATTRDQLKCAREQAISDEVLNRQLKEACKTQVEVVEAERDRLFGELVSVKNDLANARSRYATLCQRLLELGNDVPSVLAGE